MASPQKFPTRLHSAVFSLIIQVYKIRLIYAHFFCYLIICLDIQYFKVEVNQLKNILKYKKYLISLFDVSP